MISIRYANHLGDRSPRRQIAEHGFADHAEYAAANPLPLGAVFGPMAENIEPPKIGVGRVIQQDMTIGGKWHKEDV